MKNDKDKISSSGKPDCEDDEIIGAALSRGLARSGNIRTDRCPGPGEIAAVVEGNASVGEKDRILKHVNACTDCYELFLLTVELYHDEDCVENIEPVEEMDIVPKREYSHKIFSWRPMALAASILIMAFSLYLLLYRGSEIPKTPGELLDKTAALEEYQTPAPQDQPSEMPFRAKAKINTEADAGKVVQPAPPPPPPKKE
ncbi:MAG TPA: hypothetical protein VK469_12320 [Candidatus Kapabacteria bacterium]|nr:hypothetical protein [Candidatus Kapabacteria bacterium]